MFYDCKILLEIVFFQFELSNLYFLYQLFAINVILLNFV